jgi:O-antigen/teichoic acid export membrane protein
VATLVYMKGDLILLGHLSDARQVGLYAACQKLSEVLYIVPAVLADSAYPLLARQAGSAGSAGAGLPGQLLFDLACGSAMLCVVAALLLAPWFIVAVFGSRYEPAVGLFQWHALTALPVALELARSRWLASNERPALAWLGATLGAASSLVVNLWAMPYFGAVGAVAAALLAFSLMAWLPVLAVPALRPALALQVRALWPWARLWSAGRLWATTRRMAA